MTCTVPRCEGTGRRYLQGERCPQHTPAAEAGRPEPPVSLSGEWVTRSRQTLPSAKGGSDLNKERPGGYMSRQRAEKIAATRDALREQGTES